MKSKSKILEVGKELFFKNSIKKVSVTDIIEKADVSKMTFYRNFNNKEDLIISILEELNSKAMLEYKSMVEKDITFKEKLIKLIALKIEFSKSFSKEFLIELMHLYAESKEVTGRLAEMKNEGQAVFIQEILKAKANGEVNENLSVAFIIAMIEHYQLFIEDEKHLSLFNSTEELIANTMHLFCFGLSGNSK
ncbi:TetR/AcrR family transcriptional regulator [Flammeovirga kamogawensis]|uniref:TetR/AcrR family transcriptional regulator n=1 Tax=Flammeovirga kamogawensis TaxID=373891 RepID=A0ABX8H1U1_9BACT|nr:TetR/AcrR family transcriptional regulator [Flammeovirga kamogawensis]MBB6464051.1 AcrR family transcriptional regulator [Flammeovirga kamogawensis]QWG09865.1 TetR/AcrR family transcriptional regulator [Flammeovirga kamogawensis]TRX65372.1 TetR/AcrR family transcriptional regulator [Flammeovirga kamogawensis]